MAKELGVNTESLRQWGQGAGHGGDGDAVTPVEREGLKRLPKRELEKEILRNCAYGSHLRNYAYQFRTAQLFSVNTVPT